MALLKEKEQKLVREKFAKEMKNSVKIKFFHSKEDQSEETKAIQEILEEVKGLSGGKILLEILTDKDIEAVTRDKIDKFPVFLLMDETEKISGVRFFGLPAGHEFATLLHTITYISNDYKVELSEEMQKKVRELHRPVKIQVFVTTSCPHCPPAVIVSHYFAMLNPLITSEMIEANQFDDLSGRYGVQSVPMIVINDGKRSFVGVRKAEELYEEISRAV